MELFSIVHFEWMDILQLNFADGFHVFIFETVISALQSQQAPNMIKMA